MRAELTSDHTVRTITIMVEDGPIVDVTRPWQSQERRIKVAGAEVKINPDGEKIMKVIGGLVLKGDRISGNIADSGMYSLGGKIWGTRDIATAPAMLQVIFAEAEGGMRVWRGSAEEGPGRAGGADLAEVRCALDPGGVHIGCDHDPDRAPGS